jgi:hypothetical protein
MLTVIDEYTRQCLAIEVARRLRHDDVLDILAVLFARHGPPDRIRSDNGSEFTAIAVRDWLPPQHLTCDAIPVAIKSMRVVRASGLIEALGFLPRPEVAAVSVRPVAWGLAGCGTGSCSALPILFLSSGYLPKKNQSVVSLNQINLDRLASGTRTMNRSIIAATLAVTLMASAPALAEENSHGFVKSSDLAEMCVTDTEEWIDGFCSGYVAGLVYGGNLGAAPAFNVGDVPLSLVREAFQMALRAAKEQGAFEGPPTKVDGLATSPQMMMIAATTIFMRPDGPLMKSFNKQNEK